MKANELTDQLNSLTTQVGAQGDQLTKAQTEIVAEIANLKNALTNVDLPVEATTALANLTAAVAKISPIAQALDDLNPDAPAPTP